MFGLAAGYYQNYIKQGEVRVLIIGLDGSGKSATLERLKVTDFKSPSLINTERRVLVPRDVPNLHSSNSVDSNDDSEGSLSSTDSGVVVTHSDASEAYYPRTRFACPAPLLYRRVKDDDDDEIYTTKNNGSSKEVSMINPSQPNQTSETNTQTTNTNEYNNNTTDKKNIMIENMKIDQLEEKTMFPMHLLKPTGKYEHNYDASPMFRITICSIHLIISSFTYFDVHTVNSFIHLVGMNLAKFEVLGAKVKAMDLGGSVTFRPMWDRYYSDVDAIAFIVDISPNSSVPRLMESRASYRCMRDNDELEGLPILIFGNKYDKQHTIHDSNRQLDVEDETLDDDRNDEECNHPQLGILNEETLTSVAGLFLYAQNGSNTSDDPNDRDYFDDDTAFFAGSAKTGEGIRSAFQWLISTAMKVRMETQVIR